MPRDAPAPRASSFRFHLAGRFVLGSFGGTVETEPDVLTGIVEAVLGECEPGSWSGPSVFVGVPRLPAFGLRCWHGIADCGRWSASSRTRIPKVASIAGQKPPPATYGDHKAARFEDDGDSHDAFLIRRATAKEAPRAGSESCRRKLGKDRPVHK